MDNFSMYFKYGLQEEEFISVYWDWRASNISF